MRKLKTKLGIMYYEKAKYEPFEYVLYDSDKTFITNIYEKETLTRLKNCNTIGDLATELADYIIFADSKENLLKEINFVLKDRYGDDAILMTMDELEDNDFQNRIGDYYILFADIL